MTLHAGYSTSKKASLQEGCKEFRGPMNHPSLHAISNIFLEHDVRASKL